MSLKFTKMHGLGNDFVVIDGTVKTTKLTSDFIQKIADRKTGVGFDQLLLIEPSFDDSYDFEYRIFNADGQEVEQCGNGARCVGHYIYSEKLSNKPMLTLNTLAGKIELKRGNNGQITVNMGQPIFIPEKIPLDKPIQALQYELSFEGKNLQFGAVSLGNPHAVFKVNNIAQAPVARLGQLLQTHPVFPKQVNVGFMEVVSPSFIRLRVYERGVGETRSCGSGACAAVIIGRLCHHLSEEVTVELPGGNLLVAWAATAQNVYLNGPAVTVFKGELLLA